jgi:LysR family transcriptional regulator for bpeEF and oprC
VVPRLEEFFQRYPAISVESSYPTALSTSLKGVDVAIHNGEMSDSTLIVRKIAATPIVTVAAPEYLATRGVAARPGDLERHSCVIFSSQGTPRPWGFRDEIGNIVHHPKGSFRTNDAEQIRAAVLANLGLAHTPGWMFEAELASGAVRRVLQQFEPRELPIYAVHPGGRRLTTKVRVFINFVAEMFASESCPGSSKVLIGERRRNGHVSAQRNIGRLVDRSRIVPTASQVLTRSALCRPIESRLIQMTALTVGVGDQPAPFITNTK